ncbi:tetratricopeptide repeat protein 41-like [Astyanax mexicanus]|uniref:Tetratricopeptide repeat protein 41-like n=1 Tax=Astyanax mexicanus TaxID=7994 RepID=A0A8T2M6R4_ASTMX|nr:tetratricopeptide repeat protein 41-like [Astyanax mexicanus]
MSGGNTQSVKGVTSRCCSASHLAPLLQPYLCYVPGDLQQELAYLRSHVFPHLDSLCQARGTCFRPVDIQQTENGGDDDENQSDHNLQTHHTSSSHFQQLKISLDLISSSSSFFCILGQHYDCCLPESSHSSLGEPEEEPSLLYERKQYLHNAVRGGYPWVMEEQHRTCSLTELEITQAVFMGKNIRCFFYFKDLTAQGDDEEGEDGALFPGDLSNQRQCERQRMWNMKSWIINTCLPVRFFTSLQELKELVKKDWTTIIDQFHQIPEHCCLSGSGQDSLEVLNQESYIQALDHGFVPSKQTAEVLDLLNRFVFPVTQPCNKTKSKPYSDTSVQLISNKREQEKSILLLSGERGCGKSSLAVRWLQQFRNRNPKVPVIPYFCGTSVSSKDIRSMLRQCSAELRKNVYGDLPVWTEDLEGLVEPRPLLSEIQAFIAAAKLGPCIILIDGLDLLKDTFGLSLQEVKEMRWLPVALPSLCKLIVTTTTSDLTYKSLTNRSDIQVFTCPGISDPSIQCSILYRHLALPCKELSTSLLQKIIRRKICRLPVFLAVLGSELRTCGMQRDEKEENELIEEYLEVDSVSQLWEKVIRRWVKDYSRPAEDPVLCNKRQEANVVAPKPAVSSPLELRGWVWDALCLIHVSRSGLTQAEVLALLEELGHCGSSGIRTLEWAQLRTAFGPWVQEKPNSCLCFNHQSLSQAIDLLLLGVADKQKSRSDFHHIIAEFFQKRSKGLCGWLRKLEELPWHLAQTGSFKELYSVLSDPEAVCILSSSVRQYPQLRLDLVRYWTLLSQREYDPVSSLQRPTVLNGCGKRDLGSRVKLALFSFDLLLGLGKPEEAGKILSEAETVLQQADELDEDSVRSLLEVQNMLAKFYFYLQQLDEAELYSSKGLKTADILTVSSSSHSENIRMIKGQFLCFLSQIELKRGCLYTVPGLLKEISSTGLKCIHPCAEATVTLLQGLYKFAVGELSAAESCVEAVLASRRRWYGTEHPLVAAVEEQLADIWTDSNHTDKDWTQRKATELFRHVIHVRERVIKSWGMTSFLSRPMLQDLTNTLLKLGKVLMQSSCAAERREALSLLQRATDLSHLLNAGHPLSRHRQHVFNTDISVVKKRLDTPAASRSRACLTSRLLTKPPLLHQSRLTSTQPGPATAPLEPKQNIEKTLTRPWTTFQTSVFGPQSDIRTLVPREEVCGSRKISSKEGSDKRPDRCRVQEEAVKALNRQMGMYVYRKSAR